MIGAMCSVKVTFSGRGCCAVVSSASMHGHQQNAKQRKTEETNTRRIFIQAPSICLLRPSINEFYSLSPPRETGAAVGRGNPITHRLILTHKGTAFVERCRENPLPEIQPLFSRLQRAFQADGDNAIQEADIAAL